MRILIFFHVDEGQYSFDSELELCQDKLGINLSCIGDIIENLNEIIP